MTTAKQLEKLSVSEAMPIMTQHTPQSISRRIKAAVATARRLFAEAGESNLDQIQLKALRRLERAEDDVRFLERYEGATRVLADVERGYELVSAARQTICAMKEETEVSRRAYRELQIAALEAVESDRRRENFARRCNFNLCNGR